MTDSEVEEDKIMQKAIECARSFIEYETGDYGHFQNFRIEGEEVFAEEATLYVNFDFGKTCRSVKLRISEIKEPSIDDNEEPRDRCKIEVQLCEDHYEECRWWGWQIKYFWMALLRWD